jgi:hypothetical protein
MELRGTKPTSSDPVTRMPRERALSSQASKATCSGVTSRSVRFMEIWAQPYSGIDHPSPRTALSMPGFSTWVPSGPGTVRPFSRTSKATRLAHRLSRVLMLTL